MGEVRWLTGAEETAWRSYIVATLSLRQRLHREMADTHGVSLADYEVLVVLDATESHSLRMSELATMLASTKSRLSHQVARMESEGLVRRVPDPEDKRGVVAQLQPAGVALLEKAAPTHVEGVRSHLIDLLSEEEQVVIGRVFTRVLDHLTSLGE